jgi:hypothetical protein
MAVGLNNTMDDAVEDSKPAKSRFSRLRFSRRGLLKVLLGLAVVFCIGLAIYVFITWKQSIPPALPQEITSSVYYQIYEPSHMPKGYTFKSDSVTSHNGLIFYKFVNGKKVITVTQQATPKSNIDLSKLEGYTSLQVPAGKAASGQSVGNPSAIIITDSTLINITSSKGVTKQEVTSVAQRMKPAEQP